MDLFGPGAGPPVRGPEGPGGLRREASRQETQLIRGEAHEVVADPAPADALGTAGATPASGSLHPLGSIPALSSLPGAPATLYLDFDGHYQATWGAWSNITTPVYDIDGDGSTFSDRELANIEATWRAVAEDYAPFNVNVTTIEPAVLAPGVPEANANKVAMRIAIGGTSDWMGASWGGYAYINSFTSSMPNVAYVFAANADNQNWLGLTVSHEAGHTFGLQHQSTYDAAGNMVSEYNHGDPSWAPLMGSTWYATQTTTWHNGTSRVGPTSYQDDMAILAGTTNGFGYRADDHANAATSASPLSVSGSTWSGAGLIAQNTDVDFHKFTVGVADTYRAVVRGLESWSNLDAALELRSAAGVLLAAASPVDSPAASIVRYLAAGTYTLAVKTSGAYGWVGRYTVAVDAPAAGITVRSTAPMSTSEGGRATTFTVALDTRPTAPVSIPVASSNPAEGTVSTSSLFFDGSNWDVPQAVTVTGVADGVADDDAAYLVVLGAATSADPDYDARDAADLALVNIDTDAAGSLYRVDPQVGDAIVRSRLDGSQPEAIVDLDATFGAADYNPRVIALDPVTDQIYWNDATTDAIYRANLDGTGATVVVTTGGPATYGLALDPVGRKLYWPELGVGLRRANLDGSGAETIFAAGPSNFRSVAVDPAGGKLYFTDTDADVIRRTNLDGSAPEVVYTSGAAGFNGHVTLDVAAGKMYWTDPGMNAIYRAGLDGSGVERLVDFTAYPRVGTGATTALSYGLALDLAAGTMYWTDFVSKTLYRASLDGSKVVLLASNVSTDGLLVVPPTPGVSVSPRSGLVTTEAGGTATFTVALATRPTADVTIPVSTGDATEGTVSTVQLTFTPANWNIPQAVTITGVDDAAYDLDVAYAIVLGAATSADPAYSGLDPVDVAVTNADNDPPPTKFYVVNDGSPDRTYEYGPAGNAVEDYALNGGNTAPRGAASTAAGDRVWVVDSNKKVFVYDAAGALLGSWTAGGLPSNATIEGIATDGIDVWIVDARGDRVYRFTGAASRLSGTQAAASSFALNSGNRGPKDIVTDGTSLWVVNDASTDKVFKYALAGTLLGSWTITGAGAAPTGITLDPAGGGALWIVDSGTDRIYQFDNARGRTSGSQSPATSFALAAGNTNPQGLADPPAGPGRITGGTPGSGLPGRRAGGDRVLPGANPIDPQRPSPRLPLGFGSDPVYTDLALALIGSRATRRRIAVTR